MDKTVLLATFSVWLRGKRTPINGMIEPMLSYLLPQRYEVDLIDGLHPGSSKVVTFFEQYKDKTLKRSLSGISILLWPILKLQNTNATQFVFKLRDFLSVFEWAVRSGKKYDLFIGLESIYTTAGILLKLVGRAKTVVYYVSDYSPTRYANKLLNSLYLWLDRFCCYHADYVWDVSKAFQPARIRTGLDETRMKPLVHVPNALFPKQVCPLPISKGIPFSLVYAGTLTQWNGPDVAVAAVGLVKKKFPGVTLHIYGTNGKDQARVRSLIDKLELEKSVFFHGFIGDVVKLSRSINRYLVGLAPYRKLRGSHRAYGDATKLRLYMGAGLPLITTSVPPLGREVADYSAGLLAEDNPQDLARVIINIFSDISLYKKLKTKAIAYARHNTWNNTYDAALGTMSRTTNS